MGFYSCRFATSIPKSLSIDDAVIRSAEFLSSQIPVRAMKRLQHLTQLPKEWPGLDKLAQSYESLISCPFPGYYNGQLMEMDKSKSISLSVWLENKVKLLEQDVSGLQSQLRDMIASGSLSRHHPAIEPFISGTYTHLITMRLLASQHKSYADVATMNQLDITEEHYANIPVVTANCNLKELAIHTAEDCRAFCVEKHGEAPEVVVSTSPKGFDCKQQGKGSAASALDSLIIEGECAGKHDLGSADL